MAFCPPRDGKHASRLPLMGDLAHPLLTSLSFLSKSIEGSPGKISRHQMACHFPSLPMCWLLWCDVSDRCFSPSLGRTHVSILYHKRELVNKVTSRSYTNLGQM